MIVSNFLIAKDIKKLPRDYKQLRQTSIAMPADSPKMRLVRRVSARTARIFKVFRCFGFRCEAERLLPSAICAFSGVFD